MRGACKLPTISIRITMVPIRCIMILRLLPAAWQTEPQMVPFGLNAMDNPVINLFTLQQVLLHLSLMKTSLKFFLMVRLFIMTRQRKRDRLPLAGREPFSINRALVS